MSGDLLKRLAEAGTPLDLIMEVAETLAEARAAERLLEKRRAKDRQRKRNSKDSAETAETAESVEIPSPFAPPKKDPEPQKIHPPISPNRIAVGARPKFPAPQGVTNDQWKAFRQQRKKALNERSYSLLCNKLTELADAGWPPGDMIDLAVERGWETVFAPRDQGNGRQNGSSIGSMGGPRPDPTLALVRGAIAAQR